MNLALRKLAMLEESMVKKEEHARINGYTTCVIDRDLKERISNLIDKVRTL